MWEPWAGALAALGVHVLATQSYMSWIRGGLSWFDLRLADGEIHGPAECVELLVALTPAAMRVLGLAEPLFEML